MQTQTSNTLHNAIMEAGSKDRPPMLTPGNYVQWKSRIKRYIDTKPNHELIHYCLTNPPYKLGIHNDIYLTVDACPNACEMWKAIERLKQAGSKDRPPMLASSNYVQWKSRIKRYIDIKPNHELIHYCLENPPYELGWKDEEVSTSEGSLITTTKRVHETYKNVSQEIRDQPNAEAEAVQIILTGRDNVFAMESVHPEQSKSVHDTYLIEQDAQNVIIDSLDMNYDREEIDQNDDDNDLAKTLTVESPIPTVSSPVPTACLNDSPEPSSETRLISKRVANQEETPSLDNILSQTNRFEYILGVTTSSDEAIGVEADISNMETTISTSPTPTLKIHKDHPKSQIIGPVDTPIRTRHKSKEARLVAQGHTQEEWIDYDEVFAPVARIEAIRLFLAYASFMGFTVYQMDVKSAFLYGTIDEKVYVMQPPGF
nr:copia protein [Tanacetum cinerariifolium]